MKGVVARTKALIDLAHALPIPGIYTRVDNDPAIGPPLDRARFFHRHDPARCAKYYDVAMNGSNRHSGDIPWA